MATAEKDKILNVPNLRFPEFSGEWEKSDLSKYLTVNTERNKKGEFTKDDVLSVSGDYGIVNQIDYLGRSFAGKSISNYNVVRNGNIVYTKSPLKEYPYGIIKENSDHPGIVSTLYAVYNVNENACGKFIEYYFGFPNRINHYLKPIVRIGAKHTIQVGNEEVLANTVSFPSKAEQSKIATFLNLIDTRIATQNKIIEDFKKLRGAMKERLVYNNKSFKLRLPISHFGVLKNGYAFKSSSYTEGGKYKIITISNVMGERYINDADCNTISQKPGDLRAHQVLQQNDILISLTGNVGRVSLCKAGDFLLNQRVGLLSLYDKRYTEYVYQLLSSAKFENAMIASGQGAAQMNIGKSDIEDYEIPYCDDSDMIYKIGMLLNKYDEIIINESARFQLYNNLKQFFLQQMFI